LHMMGLRSTIICVAFIYIYIYNSINFMQNCFSSFFCALNTKGYAKTQFKPRDIEEEEAIFFLD
jgi:hypothetical protein